jgi:hypothetical protein
VRASSSLSGQTGVTTNISSFTVSKMAVMVGRSRMASGKPNLSGGTLGRFSICRTMS